MHTEYKYALEYNNIAAGLIPALRVM
jgi:hypothetical protein